MKRFLRKLALVLLLIVFSIALLLLLVAKSHTVQTFVAQAIAGKMSSDLGAEVKLDRIEFDPFSSLLLHGFVLFDQQGDTLIAIDKVGLGISRLAVRRSRYVFSELELYRASFRLKQIHDDGTTNLDFAIDYLSPEKSDSVMLATEDVADLFLSISGFSMFECDFSYSNPFADSIPFEQGLNPNDVALGSISGRFEDFRLLGDTIRCNARSFAFREKSGLVLEDLKGGIEINPNAVELTEMLLHSSRSKLQGSFALRFENFSDFQEFTQKVELDADFQDSKVHFADIGFFAQDLYGTNFPLHLSGKVSGTIADLKGRDLFIIAGERTIFRGRMDLMGLPDFDNTFIDLRVSQLSTDFDDLEALRLQLNPDGTGPGLPDEIARAGALFFQGSFTGFPSDFVAFGELSTEVGKLVVDLNVQESDDQSKLYYTGHASTKGFDIGRMLGIKDLGVVVASAEVKAESEEAITSAQLKGQLQSFEYKGYRYRDIDIDGQLMKQAFSGKLRSRDPNVDFSFSGLVDFGLALPAYDFNAEIYNLDLTALNLVSLPHRLHFSTTLDMNARGNELADFSGTAAARNSFLCYGDTTLLLEEIVLSSLGNEEARKVTFTSDVVDIGVVGRFELDELYPGFHQMLAFAMPSLRDPVDLSFDAKQVYDFSINYKAPNIVSGLFLEGFTVAPNTTLYGSFNNKSGVIETLLRSTQIGYGDYMLNDVVLNAGKQGDALILDMNTDKAMVGSMRVENSQLTVKAVSDILDVKFGWFNADQSSSGDLALDAVVFDLNTVAVNLNDLSLKVKNSAWSLGQAARIDLDTSGVFVDRLELSSRDQKVIAFGKAGKDADDEMMLLLKEIDLAYLDSLGIDVAYHFDGIVNADIRVRSILDVPIVTSQSSIKGFGIDGFIMGNIELYSAYNREGNALALEGTLSREAFKVVDFDGSYEIESEEPLTGQLTLDGFDLELINLFNLGVVDSFSGKANGKINVKGTLSSPLMTGFIDLDKARFRVDYLNTFFEFSDRLRVEEDWFGIDYKPIFDQEGRKGFVVASAFHENFGKWSYDISAEVDQFLVLDTDRSMNDVFYGTARATGFLQIGGFDDFLEISIEAKTGRGTSLKLPLDEPSEVTLENFVRFTSRDESPVLGKAANLEGISMRLNIEATPDAEIQLIFDERAGDIIRGKGRGLVTLEIAPSGEFQMFGRYEIVEGSYLFTLQNLVNKQFQVRPGSTVSWYGNPYEADLDIDAVYGLRTQLYPIMIENRDRYRTREDVNVVLSLTDKLLNPAIEFDIELPQSTDLERSQLASVVSTTQQLNQQVFALLILNRFLPAIEDESQGGIGGLGSATTSDFVSSQISNWLSEISNDFDIGVNYRPGDQISNQEIAVALSTQLFNERVLVSGQFGVTAPGEVQQNLGQSGIVGDFLLEYLITEDGKIRLKVFNETNPYEVFSTGGSTIYTQGVGLVYMEDFDTLEQLFRKVGKLFSNDKAKKAEGETSIAN